jgi:dihydrofolate synthase/folylpolyglutamate synthase
MERLLSTLGNPEQSLRCLHVAGTNGKGSVCAFAESVLRNAGYHTGFYSSPHLVDFSERIRIDGKPVDEERIAAGVGRLRQAVRDWNPLELPTFFELVTALAFDLFAGAGCEIIVLETGLGGRLDATNTVPKIACAITPIGLDHTEWLGVTLAEIAREKAGILRTQVPVVIAPQEPRAAEVLSEVAAQTGAPCVWVNEPLPSHLRLGLTGSHQRWNAAVALALLHAGKFSIPEEAIRKGLADVYWPGRFQRLRNGKLILDGAHNLHAVRSLVATWHEEYGDQKCQLIFGALLDKHPLDMLLLLEQIAEKIFLVPVVSPRSVDPQRLLETLPSSKRSLYHAFPSLREAMASVFSSPPASDATKISEERADCPSVLVTGSLFLVGEVLAFESGGQSKPRIQ